MDHPFIVGFCQAMADMGVGTLRFNFPYMEAGRRSPGSPVDAMDAFRAALDEAVSRTGSSPVLVGGKSYGGRMASMCVADGMKAAGLVFLGYPLHPPGKPGQIRDQHLYEIDVPMLFLQGTRDPFANTEVLEPVLSKLGPRATFVPFEGAGHSFQVRGVRADPASIGASLAEPAAEFVKTRTS
jgi:hypothetical protein